VTVGGKEMGGWGSVLRRECTEGISKTCFQYSLIPRPCHHYGNETTVYGGGDTQSWHAYLWRLTCNGVLVQLIHFYC